MSLQAAVFNDKKDSFYFDKGLVIWKIKTKQSNAFLYFEKYANLKFINYRKITI